MASGQVINFSVKALEGGLKAVTVEFNTDTGYMEVYIPQDPRHKIPASLHTRYNEAWREVQALSDEIEKYLKTTDQKPFVQDNEWPEIEW